jgi:hypothetical protein
MWPSAVAGETIMGAVPVPDSPQWTVVGADLHTGRRTWTRPGGFDEATVEQVAGDVALLRGTTGAASGPDHLAFVDVTTGRTITELDHPEKFVEFDVSTETDQVEPVLSCGDDDDTLIACAGRDDPSTADEVAADDDLVAVFRVDERTVTTELVDYGNIRVIDGWHGRAELAGSPPGDPYPEKSFTMDSAGNVIDKDLRLPGRLEELTADRATFITGTVVEVYEVVR